MGVRGRGKGQPKNWSNPRSDLDVSWQAAVQLANEIGGQISACDQNKRPPNPCRSGRDHPIHVGRTAKSSQCAHASPGNRHPDIPKSGTGTWIRPCPNRERMSRWNDARGTSVPAICPNGSQAGAKQAELSVWVVGFPGIFKLILPSWCLDLTHSWCWCGVERARRRRLKGW